MTLESRRPNTLLPGKQRETVLLSSQVLAPLLQWDPRPPDQLFSLGGSAAWEAWGVAPQGTGIGGPSRSLPQKKPSLTQPPRKSEHSEIRPGRGDMERVAEQS